MVPTKSSKPAAFLYLALNDTVIEFGQQDAEWFMYQVVVDRPSIDEIAGWLRAHAIGSSDAKKINKYIADANHQMKEGPDIRVRRGRNAA